MKKDVLSKTDIFLLAIISDEKPLTLSEIVKRNREREVINTSRTVLYHKIEKLVTEKLATTFWENNKRKYYKITQKGTEYFQQFKNQMIRAELC